MTNCEIVSIQFSRAKVLQFCIRSSIGVKYYCIIDSTVVDKDEFWWLVISTVLSEFVKLRNNYIHSFLLFLLVFIFLLQPFVFRDIKKL